MHNSSPAISPSMRKCLTCSTVFRCHMPHIGGPHCSNPPPQRPEQSHTTRHHYDYDWTEAASTHETGSAGLARVSSIPPEFSQGRTNIRMIGQQTCSRTLPFRMHLFLAACERMQPSRRPTWLRHMRAITPPTHVSSTPHLRFSSENLGAPSGTGGG